MKLDFHTHGKLAKKLPFSTAYTDWLFDEARRTGLDALCLTEHFNTLQFDELYGYLASVSRRDGDTLLLENGLRVFPGMETDVAEGGHILSIGPMEAILELNRRLAPHKEKEGFLPFASLMQLFSDYPVLVGCGHPFRTGGHVPELPGEQLRHLAFLQRKRPRAEPRTDGKTDIRAGTETEHSGRLGERHASGGAVRMRIHGVRNRLYHRCRPS